MDWQFFLNSSATLLVSAFLLDLAVGDPRWLPHPVVLMGKFISRGERFLWSGAAGRDFFAGMALSLVLLTILVGATWMVLYSVALLPPMIGFLLTAGLASTTLATRGLLDAIRQIETPLRSDNLVKARENLAHIVGRETATLNEDKILRASLESLAENTNDGIVAPLFYLFLGGVPMAMVYKAVNTLDSMIGYRSERYLYFGKFAARLDDVVNFIPARLTAFIVTLSAVCLRLHGLDALRVTRRDAQLQPSPNSGYPEAAFAGALGIRLGGLNFYRGQPSEKAYLGEARRALSLELFPEVRRLFYATSSAMLAVSLLISAYLWGIL